jgi:hypothetical protein
LIADKTYDADHFRWLARPAAITAVVPTTRSHIQSKTTPVDGAVSSNDYSASSKLRDALQQVFGRLARNDMAAIALAAVMIAWIN